MFGLFCLSLLLFCNHHYLVSTLNDEGFALLSFKNSITQDPYGSMSNWNRSDPTPCSWNGITCNQLRVVSISIPKKRLFGTLIALKSLPYLRHVNLRNNNIHGTLPSELFSPKSLRSLVLFGNSLSGNLPDLFQTLEYLQTLDLSNNLFNGSIPTSLIKCNRLRLLDLSHNNFAGYIPNGFGSGLILLQKLDLSFNAIGGSIPIDIGNLSSLQGTVDFSHNLFSGSIPATLGNLPEKVYIDLTYNNLSGAIPQNGALMNRGPTAFLGNLGLCGPPLKNPCSNSHLPSSLQPCSPNGTAAFVKNEKRRISRSVVIAIIVSDVAGILLLGLLFSCCYSRIRTIREPKDENVHGFDKELKKECLCFRKDEIETPSDNVYDLVPLDPQVSFDLNELLKASAFVLGKSGIGIVYKVVLEDGLNLAVRRLGEGGSQRFKEFQAEVESIGKLRHPNIVTLRAYYWSVDEKLLIYDYIPNGNLSAAIHRKGVNVPFTPLPWPVRFRIMKGIAKGLAYLQELSPKKHVHGDLNPNSILLGQNMEPHIADFGLGRLANIAGGSSALQSIRISEKASEPYPNAANLCALSSCYQAPEVLKVVKPSQKWDVYSYGVILLEMITGRSPEVKMDLVRWIQICMEEEKMLVDVLDPSLAEDLECQEEIVAVLKIIMACVAVNPERRPFMRHVCDAFDRLHGFC